MHELGPLRVGRNMTDFAWDGTDEFGDRLARGVYLYRVIAQLNGQDIEYRETGVILEVKPRININNVVSLQISQEVSRVQPVGEDQFGNPTIAQRRITSSVNVTSGLLSAARRCQRTV